MFGIEMRNQNNSLIVAGGEQPLQFYGKMTISSSNFDVIPLLNIPDRFACQIYAVITSGTDHAEIVPIKRNGVWNVSIFTNSMTVADIYIFTSAEAFPKASWGIEVYDGGKLMYTSSKAILSIDGLSTATVDIASMSTGSSSHSSMVSSPKKVAAQCMMMWIKCLMTGMGQFSIFRYNIAAFSSNGVHKHGVGVLQKGTGVNQSYTQGVHKEVGYAVIDCAYYDRLPALSTYKE